MANPFLVLGGIAISVATAAFGILQVPGWVASAQDAAAVNDLAQVVDAQAAQISQSGEYADAVAAISATAAKVTRSAGVQVVTAVDPTAKHHVTIARSQSGVFFARTSDSAAIGRGSTTEAAVTATGTTVTGPADARVTSKGVPVPDAMQLSEIQLTNLITNPSFEGPQLPGGNRASASFFTGWAADGARSVAALRNDHTLADAYLEFSNLVSGGLASLEPNTTYTVMGTYRLSAPMNVEAENDLIQRLSVFVHLDGRTVAAPVGVNVAGERTLRATFTTPSSLAGYNTIRLYAGDAASAPHRLSWDKVGLFKGDVPAGSWFTGDTPDRDGLKYGWLGEPHNSPSIAYR